MTAPERYATPLAFKSALEARIRQTANERGDRIGRLRQLLVFERFLARVFAALGERVVLKGGVALELRLARARTTRDIDLRLTGSASELLGQLRESARLDLGDWLEFEVGEDRRQPTLDGEGLVYQGHRFQVVARLAGKPYGDPFGLDVGMADVLSSEPERISGSDFFDFVGLTPATFRIYPRAAHVAESSTRTLCPAMSRTRA